MVVLKIQRSVEPARTYSKYNLKPLAKPQQRASISVYRISEISQIIETKAQIAKILKPELNTTKTSKTLPTLASADQWNRSRFI